MTFVSGQANSTNYAIIITDDSILEGKEYFRLRISAIRPIGQVAQFYIPQAGANNTFVDICIEDDDSKLSSSSLLPVYLIASNVLLLCHAFIYFI